MNAREKRIKSFLGNIEGWKSVLDSSTDLITILDKEFNVIWTNKAMAQNLNISPDLCIGLKCFKAVHGTESPIPNCPHAKMILDGQEYTEEINEENLGGCFIVTASPVKDEFGNILGSVHIVRDIRERKKAEEKIQRLADVVKSSDDAIITKSLEGTIISWNRGAEQIYGYSAEEILGEPISILESYEFSQETEILINKIKNGEKIDHYETLRLRKDSKKINVSITLSPVFDTSGELVAISTIARDITERKRAEKQKQELLERTQQFAEELDVSNEELQVTTEELQASNEELQNTTEELQAANEELQVTTEELQASNEELQTTMQRFYTILSNMRASILLVTDDGLVEFVNPAFCNYFDLAEQPEELVGLIASEMIQKIKDVYQHPDEAISRIREIVDHWQPVLGEEVSMQGGKTCLRNFIPISIRGEHYGRLWVHNDITERKKKEKELHQLNRAYRALSNSSQAMIRAKTELEYLEEVCRIIIEDCGHSMVWIGYAEEDECKTVQPVAYSGFEEGYLETLNVTWADTERGHGPTGTAIRTGKPSFCKNMLTDPKFKPWRKEAVKRGYASSVVIPLMTGNKAFGALSIYSVEPDPFSEDEIKLLTELADDIAYGINAIRLRIALEQSESALREAKDNLEDQVKERTAELEKAYESLKFANAYNRSLIEASLDPLVTIGPDGKITDVNYSTERVTGYSRDELMGTDFSNYFTQPENAREGYKQVFRDGWVIDYPLEIKHRNGHVTPVLYNASVYEDESGDVIGVFAAARDITELKRAEAEKQKLLEQAQQFAEELEVSNEELQVTTEELQAANDELKFASKYNRSLIEASPDPLVTIGSDGKITDVNWATELVTGYSRDEIIGTDFSDYFTEPEKARSGYQEVFREGRVFDYLLEIKHKDGHVTPVLYNASVYEDESGDVVGVFAAARDITERKKAEKELEFASKYNRSLIEASVDPLVTIGPDGKITDVNNSTESATGFVRDELIGTDFSDYFTEPEKARSGYQHVFQEGFVKDYPLDIQHKDGHITPVLYNASVYRDDSGDVIGVFAAARDITERKKAEKLLKLKIEELARSNAELEQFAYVSSHDLQEPLRMIGSYLQLLQRRYHGELDDKADKYINFAVDGASRMQNLINDLLEFSRVTTQAREFEPTDSELVLNQVLSNLEVSIKENEAVISHDQLPTVMADSTQLVQVFQNLISNAIKFRSEKAPKIYISARKEDDQWIFSVDDNGIGIDLNHSERIFEVFKRLHKRREYPGTGIGLSICKKIIERHGGHIWVESEPGKGSVFYFTLPGEGVINGKSDDS
jgi:PAS domain S-box-containing protein